MTCQPPSILRLRWLAALLLSLLWVTMGNAVTLAEHGDFGSCALAAGRGEILPRRHAPGGFGVVFEPEALSRVTCTR
jgi:hypothetical protein